jgi:hypothetical protein
MGTLNSLILQAITEKLLGLTVKVFVFEKENDLTKYLIDYWYTPEIGARGEFYEWCLREGHYGNYPKLYTFAGVVSATITDVVHIYANCGLDAEDAAINLHLSLTLESGEQVGTIHIVQY